MAIIIETGVACTDCALILANDEGTDEHRERMATWLDGTPGEVVLGDLDNTDLFSTARCDTCGTDLAGERFPVAFIN